MSYKVGNIEVLKATFRDGPLPDSPLFNPSTVEFNVVRGDKTEQTYPGVMVSTGVFTVDLPLTVPGFWWVSAVGKNAQGVEQAAMSQPLNVDP
jgi:hypothetical protein